MNGAGIPVPQQQMQLMRIQRASAAAIGFGPSGEAPLRKPFLAEPKTLTVVDQAFDGVTTTRTKDKECPAQWVAGKSLTAQGCQAVDAFAEIDRLNRQEDPHVRSDLDHER